MRILEIILHSIFAIIGSLLIFKVNLDVEIIYFLTISTISYTCIFLIYLSVRDIIFLSYPRQLGLLLVFAFFLYQFYFKQTIIGNQQQIISLLINFSAFSIYYFLGITLLAPSSLWKYRKIKVNTFLSFYMITNIFSLITIIGIVVFYFSDKTDTIRFWNYSLAMLVVMLPAVSKDFVKSFISISKKINNQFDFESSFNQFSKLARIKNFVFAKDKFISSGIYQITDSDFRSSIRVMTVMKLAYQLSNDWDKKYTKLFVLDDYQRDKIKYSIVENNENGISVIDDNAVMYHFGNNSFMRGKIKKDDSANLFLVKNEIAIGKFRINEKIDNGKVELVNQLDYFGNTILFNPGIKEDLGRDYSIVFDRIYSDTNEKRQFDLLKELERKAPTLFIGAKNPGITSNSLNFYLTTKVDVEKKENLVVSNSDIVKFIPQIIKISKKVHNFLFYALLTNILLQIGLLVFAFFYYNNLVLLLGVQLSLSLLFSFANFIFKKRMNYLPDQPANLDHNDQAA